MLNELLGLERGLSAHGFAAVPRHPDLSQLLKGDVVRVRLARDGAIAELDLLERMTRSEVWTLRDGKHNGFPGLKTTRGLIVLDAAARAAHDERWKTAKSPAAKRAEIERLTAGAVLDPEAGDWPKPGHRARVAERLADLRVLEADRLAAAVPAVFERFLVTLESPRPFLHRLYDRLIDRAREGSDGWLDVVRATLVGPAALALDVDGDDFARDAGDARQIEAVSRALSRGERSGDASAAESGAACALTGAATTLLSGNFPQPTLPSLGQTYLFSRNADIHALDRYRRNGPSAFPVDADLVARLSGALAMVVQEARRGKTWRLLPTESGKGQDLFIAFVGSALDEPVADSLASIDADEDEGEFAPALSRASAEEVSSRWVALWGGVANRATPDERARILIMRTVDPGNRKAVYDRSPSVHALHRAALAWSHAMHNAPQGIALTIFKDKKPVQGRPLPQKPLSLTPLSRKFYVRGGRTSVDAPGIPSAEALALFLDEGDRARRARHVLRLLLQRQTGLLAGVAHARMRGQLKDFDPKATSRRDALDSASWMGALLFFIGRNKEVYMQEAGFKLGQLLSAADAVHIGYCADVRGGDAPPTLIGNSVFAAAGRDPVKALEVLQGRWKPYGAWAKTAAVLRRAAGLEATDKGRAGQMRRAIGQARLAEQLCRDLHEHLAQLRSPPSETFRAELLLGYLAGIEPEKTSTASKSEEGTIA
jgi:hypothetical protein